MENNMVNEKEMVDMNEIIRIQKEYDVRIFNTPLVDFNMTLGEYWDRFRFGNPNDEYCDLMDKREEIHIFYNEKLSYLIELNDGFGFDIVKCESEKEYEEEMEDGYMCDEKFDIGKVAILGSICWYEWYDSEYLLRDAIAEFILEMENSVKDDWWNEEWDD